MSNDTIDRLSVKNSTGRTCTFMEEINDSYKFSCDEYDRWYACLTLLFIYLPSLNVLATLMGPRTAGELGLVWGGVMVTVSVSVSMILDKSRYMNQDQAAALMSLFFGLMGVAMCLMGIIMSATTAKAARKCKSLSLHLLFVCLLPFSPLIFIMIKLISIIKPNNLLLKAQSTLGARGESILEASPQFTLQCYIILSTLRSPDLTQWLSICTSALTISLKNIEHYVTARLEERKEKREKEEFEGTLKFKIHYLNSFYWQ